MLTLSDYISWVRSGQIKPEEVISECMEKSKKNELNSRLTCTTDYVSEHSDNQISWLLCAAPIGIKDNIMTKWIRSTCGSKILENYIPEYSATCFQNLEKSGWLMIGKNNMDEFAMGGSGENSAFGPTKNPHDRDRVPGGSSSWWAAAVANGECLGAIGTDTGGSTRQPAAFCGIVGFKPTYGNISRFGVQSMSNSLDQVGVMTKTVEDAWILYKAIAGYDAMDLNTSNQIIYNPTLEFPKKEWWKPRICVFHEFFGEGIDPRMKELIMAKIEKIQEAGYEIERRSFPLLTSLIATYYIICPAEVSTNMARFDGLRYGLQSDTTLFDSLQDYYKYIRSNGFWKEVQKRILIGAHVLSSGYKDQYYKKAVAIKNKVTEEFLNIFQEFDIVLGPTSPVRPWKIGEHSSDALADYLADAYTIIPNLIGAPAMSIPWWTELMNDKSIPYGVHIIGKPGNDEIVMMAWKIIEGL
jgi:aspartyl-tRNA(Asn)/glutamyl-tRNA(Gln) amidotransferase subunit A